MAKRKTIEERNKELALSGKKLKLYGLKLRLDATNLQCQLFNQFIGCARFTFNSYLNEKMEVYKQTKKTLKYEEFKPSFLKLKKDPNFLWLGKPDKFALENAMMDVDTAFKNFFEKRAKFPKFKKKHGPKQSYTTNMTNDNIKIDLVNKTIQLPKIGLVSFRMDKKQHQLLLQNGLKGVIKSATVSRHASGQYYVAVKLEEIVDLKSTIDVKTVSDDQIVGLDLGLKHFAILSNGAKIENPRYYQRSLKKLAKMQRRLSKMKPKSNNYIKQKEKIAKLHLHIKNMRHDFLHKVSRKIVNENQVIILENLNVKGMIKNKKLAKSIQDVGWGYFKTFVQYKAEWDHKIVVFIDRFFPSSKLCSGCNEKNTLLSLSDREWVCPNCGTLHDRDENAATNIKKEGMRLLGI